MTYSYTNTSSHIGALCSQCGWRILVRYTLSTNRRRGHRDESFSATGVHALHQ